MKEVDRLQLKIFKQKFKCSTHQRQTSTAYKECVCRTLGFLNERHGDLFGDVVGDNGR